MYDIGIGVVKMSSVQIEQKSYERERTYPHSALCVTRIDAGLVTRAIVRSIL
jgi:hypothetical protein